MKAERIDLLKNIGFLDHEISQVEAFVKCLKEKQLWAEVENLACEVMSVHPCGTMLNKNLAKVEMLEKESGICKYSLDLLLIIECTLLLKKDYEKKILEDDRYSLELFYDTMKDITYKLHECQKVYGVCGIFVGFWYDGFFDMTRFALGRLQFEITPLWLSTPVVVNGCRLEPGMEAINMHIPSCGPLLPKEADASFERAIAFFKEKFVERPVVFVMSSWLLDEDLRKLLPEGNIRKFVERFSILSGSKSDYFDDGWRVFENAWCFDRESWKLKIGTLPRNTRLQRVICDYLQQGGSFGYGYGVIV